MLNQHISNGMETTRRSEGMQMNRFYLFMTNTFLATHPCTSLVETQPKPGVLKPNSRNKPRLTRS